MKYCLSALEEIERLRTSRSILIATGYEGVLCPPAGIPSEAGLEDALQEVLPLAGRIPQLTLAVLSGTRMNEVRGRMPQSAICAGNSGLEIAGPGFTFTHPGALELRTELRQVCDALSALAGDWPGAFLEDNGFTAAFHYGKVDALRHQSVRFAVRRCVARFGRKFSFHSGWKSLEICPRVGWDKGAALSMIMDRCGPFDACVCIGEGRTDEAMFRANAHGVNVKVGHEGRTMAPYFLWEPSETAVLLEHIVDMFVADVRKDCPPCSAQTAASTSGSPSARIRFQ